jgi:hypothetical protein
MNADSLRRWKRDRRSWSTLWPDLAAAVMEQKLRRRGGLDDDGLRAGGRILAEVNQIVVPGRLLDLYVKKSCKMHPRILLI